MTTHHKLVIGTRGSQLAMWQAEAAKVALSKVSTLPIEVKVISTRGDEQLHLSLHDSKLTKGLFTEELERELISGEIDFAVHSLKDLPVQMPKGLEVAAVMERADARDVLLLHSPQPVLSSLVGLTIGSSSPRRIAQLLASGIPLEGAKFQSIRGNVPTRIEKVRKGEYDATLLALAGMQRLGLECEADHILPLDTLLPAPGQGAVAIQCATQNSTAIALARQVNHPNTQLATWVERHLLQLLGGGCALPLGAYAQVLANGIELRIAYAPTLEQKVVKHSYTLSNEDSLIKEQLATIATQLKEQE